MTDPVRTDPVRVGLLGCGNVGSALVRLVDEHADLISARAGVGIEIARVVVRDLGRERDGKLPADRFTTDADAVVRDPEIDVVVEVMGGVEPARTLMIDALRAGKPVVTANKELIARHGPELFAVAADAGVDLLFEASVAGGIPLMRPLRESLAGDRIRRVMGIVNGTTNYILTRMAEAGSTFADALAEAQELGYAEADPTADVEGHDAAAKAAIIATIAFGARVSPDDVYTEGITGVTADDIASAETLGYVVKLLAVAEAHEGAIAVRVHPAMVPMRHPLASVRDSFNAVFIEGEAVGELMLYGRGAGGGPTASAVLGDLVDAVKNLVSGAKGATIGELVDRPMTPIAETESPFYLLMEVADQPGVLSAIAGEFGRHGVSIKSMEQRGIRTDARLVFITHRAREADVRATLAALRDVDQVRRVGSVLRVVGEDD
ncbi:MAG: homoserine dehydrogenase [Acidimicrobiia bacterium]|jgi:homoserine dehydrogenase|nr:homoserine dehydrogenase [Acidimicrobiia bacterium]